MFEVAGLPRMAGRILGWLLVCVPAQQSLTEIAEVLQASKGSISMMTRLLIQIGLIDRISLPGDRRDYFQIKPDSWTRMSQQRLTQIITIRELADRGLALLAHQDAQAQARLQEMRDFHAFWERELPLLNDRWERERSARSSE
ncbi:MAG: MarR family transcriptional regulator [Microcoleus sp. SIO2G3]|nr:MarR family transcriptional regulator [Microcoleus sp. SIO2G3]